MSTDSEYASPGDVTDGLTGKQKRFVQEYLVDLNGSKAALRAGYSAASCRSIASKNLDKPEIARAIDLAMAMDPGVTRTRIVDELGKIAFAAISAKLKAADKLSALEKLGKVLGMFKDRHEITTPDGTPLAPVLNISYGSPPPPAS